MLYIPLTQATLDELFQPNAAAAVISRLKMEELAALWLLQGLPTLLEETKTAGDLLFQAEKMLATLIKLYGDFPLDELQQAIIEALDCTQCQAGADLLVQTDIQLMTVEQLHERAYLKWDEQWGWDWEYKQRVQTDFFASRLLNQRSSKTHFVAKEEERILNVILSEPNESIDIQGYAGSGKTWMISRLAEVLDKEKTAFLAESWGQVSALVARIAGARGETFANLAKTYFQANPNGYVRHIKGRYGGEHLVENDKLANHLECYAIGSYSREEVAKRAWLIVRYFCQTADAAITFAHVRKYFFSTVPLHLELMLNVALHLWELICLPRGKYIPIRDYHLIKAYAMQGLGVATEFQFIVVDESHYLSPVLIQILKQSPQPVFTFGDRYQVLDTVIATATKSNNVVRKQVLAQSMRVGANLEKTYNTILQHHAQPPDADFFGNKNKNTRTIHYDRFILPEQYCAVLAKSTWSVFCIAYDLYKRSARYHLLGRVKMDLNRLIGGAISFYVKNTKPGHYEFMSSTSWGEFVEKHKAKEPTLLWVDRLLRAGFNDQHLRALLQHSTPQADDKVYVLGRVADCRNHEFERVVLLNDIIDHNGIVSEHTANVISHIYTGISRAKHELYLPATIKDWIENI